jgi:hypothetical protein
MKFLWGALLAWAVFTAAPAGAMVLAQCGASAGHAYYEDSKPGWQPDRISTGRFIFTVDGAGNPNVLFKDVRGKIVDSAADRGLITFTRQGSREFSIVVIYPEDGTSETYNIVNKVQGAGRRLLWTSSKVGGGPGMITKVGAYAADCD